MKNEELKKLLIASAEKAGVNLYVVADKNAAARAIAEILRKKSVKRLFVTLEKLPYELSEIVSKLCEIELIDRSKIQKDLKETLITCDASVTSACFVVASTASIVLRSAPGTERSCSLIPPIHITVIAEESIVSDLNEVFSKKEIFSDTSSVVFVTGPSKTADIEKVIVKGVHGPLEEYLIVIY